MTTEKITHKREGLQINDLTAFKATMDESIDMMCLTEKNFTSYVNKTWLAFTGRSLADELGTRRFENIHPDDVASSSETIYTAYNSLTPYKEKYRLMNASGVYKWIAEDGEPIFSPNGTSLGFVSKCADIDNEKRLELRLRSTEKKYRRLFETARDGILILDSVTGEITDVNPFLIQLLGYSRDEFLGKKLWEVGAFKNTKASKDTFKLLQEDGYVRYEDLPLETKDGRLIAVEFVSNAYLAGEVRVMQCNIRDISDRKRAETADRVLTVLNQEKLKTSFIADVTHELRTPLAIIKGNIELAMRDKSIKHGFNDTFLKINLEINHLSEILSDLAILTSENSDFHIKIATSKINLNDVLHHVVNRLSVIAQKKSISIDLQTIPSGVILGDMEYLKKLFSNIISNAIYYGKEKGSITISGALADNMIIIAVSDDGIGIAKEDLANIFERFYRTDKAREANSEGTGLGLAICKWITEAHHGQISATSAQNKGTTFTIALPLAHS